MKLKSYLLFGLATLFMASCSNDYEDWKQQATNEQGSAITFGNGSIAEVPYIDFATIPDSQDSVQVCKITAPTSSYKETENTYTITMGNKTFKLDEEGRMLYSDFKTYVEATYGKNPNYIREIAAIVTAYTGDGKTAIKQILATSGTFAIKAKTVAPFIDKSYYLVGNIDGWKCQRVETYKLVNNGGDVYDNPEFSVEIEPVADIENGDGKYNIKIIPVSAFNEDGSIANWGIALSALKGVTEPAYEGNFSYDNSGDNIRFEAKAGTKTYKITVNLMEGTYKVKPQSEPELYMTGSALGWGASKENWLKLFKVNANWDDTKTIDEVFWTIRYFVADEEFKFAPQAGWVDDFGGNQMDVTDYADAGYENNGSNCKIKNAGWYKIRVYRDLKMLIIDKPEIFLIGDAVGGWDVDVAENMFTVPSTPDGEFVSPEFANDGNLRMYVHVVGDWWRSEFNVYGTSIVIRTEGDQDAVKVKAGQKAYLKFPDLTGRIE